MKIVSQDGFAFVVKRDVARQSGTLKSMISEDDGELLIIQFSDSSRQSVSVQEEDSPKPCLECATFMIIGEYNRH